MALTLNEAWRNYHEVVLAGRSSEKSEVGRWRNHIAPIVGDRRIEELTAFDYLKLRRNLEEKGLSPQTVRHCLSLLRRVMRQANEWGHITCTIPSFKRALPKFDNNRERFLNQEEAEQLLTCLSSLDKTQEWRDIALFALFTGLRKGEIFNLKASHVDFTEHHVKIVDTKTCKNRVVPLNPTCMDILGRKKNCYQTSIFSPGNLRKPLQMQ